MALKRVIEGVHVIPMGMANAFLVEGDDGLTLIDAGYPSKEAAVFGAIRGLGRSPDQLKHLIFTHGHPDHIGSAAAIVRETCTHSISPWPRVEVLFGLCGGYLVCCGECCASCSTIPTND
jgi:glyoxylase-like metal-dependent hydrolase (beta-lactamase superfamily II)